MTVPRKSSVRMRFGLLAVVLAITACGASQQYSPPTNWDRPTEMSVVVDATFDATWTRLIDLLGSSFYSIALLDKDSGFMRLDFTAVDAQNYIDCGDIKVKPGIFSRRDRTQDHTLPTW